MTPGCDLLNYGQLREQHEQAYTTGPIDWTRRLKELREREGYLLFKSKKEAKRWIYLKGQETAHHIRHLDRQVRFKLNVRRPDGLEETIGVYVADHVYEQRITPAGDGEKWQLVVEDVKGYKEDLYKWKMKHFEAQYGMKLTEV